jgi:hypothetical protein
MRRYKFSFDKEMLNERCSLSFFLDAKKLIIFVLDDLPREEETELIFCSFLVWTFFYIWCAFLKRPVSGSLSQPYEESDPNDSRTVRSLFDLN